MPRDEQERKRREPREDYLRPGDDVPETYTLVDGVPCFDHKQALEVKKGSDPH